MNAPRLPLSIALLILSQVAAQAEVADDAAAFGALETIRDAALSADGRRLVYVGAGSGAGSVAVVVDLMNGSATTVARADGDPFRLTRCDWSAANRIVCQLYKVEHLQGLPVPWVRSLAMDADGGHQVGLGQRDTLNQIAYRLRDGEVIDWQDGVDGKVLMSRSYVPEPAVGHLMTARAEQGLGVDIIDTRSGKSALVEPAGRDIDAYMSDGRGHVRLMTSTYQGRSGYSSGIERHFYRLVDDRSWRQLGAFEPDRRNGGRGRGTIPLAVDPARDVAYVLEILDGRRALYRIKLDGSLQRELVFASREVDVDGVITTGRGRRVIGASFATDRRYAHFIDPEYEKLHEKLVRALPRQPLIDFVGASADERVLIIHARGDVDAGGWYVYSRDAQALSLVMASRPALDGRRLSPVKAITYPAADGTRIPAYLTLPPGVTEARALPAIVMPHDGIRARDEWGFNWLAQFFAYRGFVVIQPNFRGSDGYGDAWFANNGYRGWKISVVDVRDAGRWLLEQGLADPSKLAVLGWGYGGYAALQVNVLDPDLFKAVIAVAPITDLGALKQRGQQYQGGLVAADFIGSGPHLEQGSPAANARSFQAPVLLFHGAVDLDVDPGQSRRMDSALRRAYKDKTKWTVPSDDKPSELVIYPKLDHELRDGAVRADLLRRSEAFLRARLGL